MSKIKKSHLFIFLVIIFVLSGVFSFFEYLYHHDANRYESKQWLGFFDHRLNFRDVGQSYNECLGQRIFQENKIFRSNKYFSGWSCEKIKSPNKIYTFNYDPHNPHVYYCFENNNSKKIGIRFNEHSLIKDTDFVSNWKNLEVKSALCRYFESNLNDLIQNQKFLYHCDQGRDRTGFYSVMLMLSLAEQKMKVTSEIQKAALCDYSKSTRLPKNAEAKMTQFIEETEQKGGFSKFLMENCHLDPKLFSLAAESFVVK